MINKASMSLSRRQTMILCYLYILTTRSTAKMENDSKIQKMVEDAGCPFVTPKQLLVRNVCLLPDYQQNELPDHQNGITRVDFYLQEALVLEIDEKKDKIKVKISQLIEWGEPRLRANFSAVSKKIVQIKLSSNNIEFLWHPDQDMYTENLEGWRSIYEPVLFQKLAVSERPFLQKEEEGSNINSIHGWKDWTVTIYCKFDFSAFPLDTQNCRFRQFGTSQTIIPMMYPSLSVDNFKYQAGEFQIRINPTVDQSNITLVEEAKNSIGFNITLQRIYQPYIYQYYLPCVSIVLVSQISFIIPISAVSGRVGLVVTQFLTLTNIFIHLMVNIIFRKYIFIAYILWTMIK